MKLRKIILTYLPNITEQLDAPAKMVAYCYGQSYAEMICTIIHSNKGLKLGFNRGVDLPDPSHILKGTGEISRYVAIKSSKEIQSLDVKRLLKSALKIYRKRLSDK